MAIITNINKTINIIIKKSWSNINDRKSDFKKSIVKSLDKVTEFLLVKI